MPKTCGMLKLDFPLSVEQRMAFASSNSMDREVKICLQLSKELLNDVLRYR